MYTEDHFLVPYLPTPPPSPRPRDVCWVNVFGYGCAYACVCVSLPYSSVLYDGRTARKGNEGIDFLSCCSSIKYLSYPTKLNQCKIKQLRVLKTWHVPNLTHNVS